MTLVKPRFTCVLLAAILTGCSGTVKKEAPAAAENKEPAPSYFKVDAATAGTLHGKIHFTGRRPARKVIDMSGDPACAEAHHGKAYDESVVCQFEWHAGAMFSYT